MSETAVITKQRFTPRDIVMVGLFAALIAVGAFIKIPFGIVSMTLQTLMVTLAALILGSRLSAVAVAIYIFIGLIGIPIFTQGGGPMYIFQPTFGYLLGFLLATILIGYVASKLKKPSFLGYLIAGICGMVITYLIGVSYFGLIMNVYLGKGMAISKMLVSCCAVFLPTDVLSCAVAALIARRLNPILHK